MIRKLVIAFPLLANFIPVLADQVINTCTIRVPTPPITDCPNANLSYTDLYGIDLSGADLSGADLRGANLSGANLSGADLSWASLGNANLKGANLSSANLSYASLIETNLSDTNVNGAILDASSMYSVKSGGMTGVPIMTLLHWRLINGYLVGPFSDLSEANLSGADLREPTLIGVILNGANLSGANLSGVDISYGNLIGANLSGADLHMANLGGLHLGDANLTGANLTDAINLDTVYWFNTTCVDGSNSENHIDHSCITDLDTDGDGIGNMDDLDDDNDGVPDFIDADPLNPIITVETVLPLNNTYQGSSIRDKVAPN